MGIVPYGGSIARPWRSLRRAVAQAGRRSRRRLVRWCRALHPNRQSSIYIPEIFNLQSAIFSV